MTTQQPEANPNENCLAGMACPKCGDFGPFNIHASQSGMTIVTDGGTDFVGGDVEWEDDSACHCLECGHHGTVGEFMGKAAPAPAGKAETVTVPIGMLAQLIEMSNAHVEDIVTGIAEGIYEAAENLDIGVKRELVDQAESIYRQACGIDKEATQGDSQ